MGTKKMVEKLILKIGMFITLGLLLRMAVKRCRHFWMVALVELSTTVGIETIQYFMGRSADIDDALMNFIGGVLGYFIYKVLLNFFNGRNDKEISCKDYLY